MVVSELTIDDVISQARISPEELDEAEQRFVEGALSAAIAYVKGYTGLPDDEVDSYPELSIAVLALAADMYDNRTMSAYNGNVNRVVDTILGMHSRNLL